MITKEFTFPSSDGKTKVHAVRWIPDSGEFKAILQITHGMQEYIERYTGFAEFLTGHGYLVVGHDHLGHGKTAPSSEDLGYFGRPNPSDLLVADMHTLRTGVQKKYPDKPYFMMGHSMGSYLLRKYLGIHSDGLSGVIIMGTGYVPQKDTAFGLKACKTLSAVQGWHHRSKFLTGASFGKPYRKFDLTGKDFTNSWISRDEAIVRKYYSDPKCQFLFTINGYQGLYEAVSAACSQETVDRYPKDLPVFLVSGANDPVGDFGVGVKKVYHMFRTAQMEDVTYRLYDEDRHEVLNELDKEQVYNDILAWMNIRLG
jgi:alpha-beta hydrolase superfamily lysophospholipase